MVTLVVIDTHHSDFLNTQQVDIRRFSSEEECLTTIRQILATPHDLIVSDADVDGYLSAVQYCLQQGIRSPQYKCFRVPFSAEIIEVFKKNGIRSIIAFDWFPLYGCDLSLFDKVVFINPRYSKLFMNSTMSHLILKASVKKTSFMKDLNTISFLSKNVVPQDCECITETVKSYPELFPELLPLVSDGKLNHYNALRSRLGILVSIFSSPVIVGGETHVQEAVRLMVSLSSFTFNDMMNFSHHPAVKYLRGLHFESEQMSCKERERFEKCKVVLSNGIVFLYEPLSKSPGFIHSFMNTLSTIYTGKILLFKIRIGSKTKYSVRQRGLLIDLGKVVHSMGVGGGHPEAAGALVEDTERFEKEFLQKLRDCEGENIW